MTTPFLGFLEDQWWKITDEIMDVLFIYFYLLYLFTTDWLVFDEGERDLPNDLQLKFEAVTQMSEEDQRAIQSLIDGMILKHTASQLAVGSN